MFRLRLAEPADLPAIVEIYNAALPLGMASGDTEPVPLESRFIWFKAHQRKQRPLWVVEPFSHSTDNLLMAGGEHMRSVLGWMCFSDFQGRPAYQHSAELSVYCHPTMQRKGLGSFLMHAGLALAPGLEIKTVLAEVLGHHTAAIRLFEKFGFQPWAQLPGVAEIGGVERDLLVYGKRLPADLA